MKQQNYESGRLGEDIARKYLVSKNYKIITSNFKTKFGEIDIITSKDKTLVFVEVKLKICDQYGSPEEMITPHKITQVQNTATAFLLQNVKLEAEFDSWRIDAVCIVLGEDKQILSLNHWENISF